MIIIYDHHGKRLGDKMMQNHCVFLSKVDSPTILAESGEGDPHDLRSLRTKVHRRRWPDDPAEEHPIPKTNRQNPYSRSCWCKY